MNRPALLFAGLMACALPAPADALPPADELATFRLADPELRVELVAAEPDVTSPVSLAWDAQGRLFVAEMNDYPTATSGGRIRRLVDRDGDGRTDHSTIFADDLHFPASVLPWRDGLLVAAAPNIHFLRDLDGDGRADERRVVLTGFAEGNQQLRVNSLTWAADGWIYGANGRSDGELRGGTLAAPLSLRRRDFRFRPDTGEVEALAGASQFGLGFDTAGNRFLSWNTIPLRHEVIPQRYLDSVTGVPGLEALQDCLDPADNQRIFPLAPAPRTFNRESTTHFNALAGLHVFGGDALGSNYVGNAFMGETLRSLVHRRVLAPQGASFVARRAAEEPDREFLAAADPWFHPVHFSTGPDGALYFCDFYRRWVEHPGFVPEKLRDQTDWREGWQHGRIWRVTRAEAPSKKGSKPSLPGSLGDRELVARLSHPNAWQRLTAQRLLLENHRPSTIPGSLVRRLADAAESPSSVPGSELGRWHALQTLDAFGRLDSGLLIRRLSDPAPAVRLAALQRLEPRLPPDRTNAPALDPLAQEAHAALLGLAEDPEASIRLRVALVAPRLPPGTRATVLAQILRHDPEDAWIQRAVLIGGAGIPVELVAALRDDSRPELIPFLARLGTVVGSAPNLASTPRALLTPAEEPKAGDASHRVALLAGIADGLLQTGRSPRLWLGEDTYGPALRRTTESAGRILADPAQPMRLRLLALGLRVATATPEELRGLRTYLRPEHSPELQFAAADRLSAAAAADDRTSRELLEESTRCSAPTRRRLLALATRSTTTLPGLLTLFESARANPVELDAATRDTLLRHPNPELRERSHRIWNVRPGDDRSEVIRRYENAAGKAGNRKQGAELFGRTCAACHRIGGRGGQIGPDLSGIGSRTSDILITDILDPSRQLASDYLAYTLATRDGESHTGLIVAETGSEIVLRRANQPDQRFPRSQLLSVQPENRSLMPDGLETVISPEAMSDLLSFLAAPDPEILPKDP